MVGFGSNSSRQSFPSWTAPFTRFAFTGQTPDGVVPGQIGDRSGFGLINDAFYGAGAFPAWDAYGGLASQVPNAQAAGSMGRQLAADATGRAYGDLGTIAGLGWGPVGQTMNIANMAPQGMDASNYYLNRGVTPGVQGSNVQGAMGAGQQVVDAALGAYRALPEDAYRRVVQQGLPEVRAASSARGLGLSGMAQRSEEDYIQRTRDALHQQDVANQIAALQAGAGASGAAASQAIGAQNAAIGRGQLGLQAANAVPGIMSGFQDVTGAPLGQLGMLGALQQAPMSALGQGLDLYTQALGLPLQYQQALYNFTRQPQLDLLSQISGTQVGQSRGWNFSLGGGNKGGGGGGGN